MHSAIAPKRIRLRLGAQLAIAALALTALAQPTPAAAAAPPTPVEAEPVKTEAELKMERAIKHYQEGVKLYRQELYKAALDAFTRAHKLAPTFPKPVFNIAKSYEKLAIADKCVNWFKKYTEIYKKANGSDPPDIGDIKNTIAKCRLGMRLEITVETSPKGAEVYLGDETKIASTTPYTTRLDPGEHRLIVKLKHHKTIRRTIVVKKGESTKFSFSLERLKTLGKLMVTSNVKGATIYVNGKAEGRTPRLEPIVLTAKTYQVSVDKADYKSVARTVTIQANESVTVDANLWLESAPSTWKTPLGWTSVGIGIALVGGGIAGSYFADREFADGKKFGEYELYQNIGYGLGGALIGVGAIFLIWDAADGSRVKPEDAISAGPTVRPTVTLSSDGSMAGAHVTF